jgi:hypothetical protein
MLTKVPRGIFLDYPYAVKEPGARMRYAP